MVPTLDEIRARKEFRKRELERELERMRGMLKDLGALRVILFGSLAADQVRSMSDIDIIAVMPPIRSGREWIRIIREAADCEVSCDILAYTEDELAQTLPVSGFLRHALETGKIVYEKRSSE
ncbi:MAG: nucleotidyltransferase domain-containing protein [Candidatus Latescibacterota bacterium]